MKKMRRGFSLLLSIVMVLGMVPVQSFATDCQHTLVYSAEGDCITAACTNEGCAYRETATLVLDCEVPLAYTGQEIKPLKVVYSEGWQGEKPDVITYVNNVEVTKEQQEKAAEPQPVDVEAEEPQPEDEKEQKDPEEGKKEAESLKIPAGTLTIGGVSATKTFAVGKAILTVTATAAVSYGDEAPEYTLDYSGLVEGEKIEDVLTGEPKVTSDYTQGVAAETEFNIVVDITDVTSEKYELKAENGKGKVARRKLTIELDNSEYTYDGQEHTPQVVVGNLAGEDQMEPDYEPVTAKDAGTYTITLKELKGDEAVLANYEEVTEGTELSFTIHPRVVDIDWGDLTIPYDGEDHLPNPTITNRVGEDDVSLELDRKDPVSDVGTYEINVLPLKGDDASNYALPQETKVIFTITKPAQEAPAGVTAVDETVLGKKDGKITGVTDAMEYMAEGAEEYIPVTGTEIDGLAAGTYLVRYMETADKAASETVEVTVAPGAPLTVTLPDAQMGYTLTADKTEASWGESVTITYKLAAGYIELEGFVVKVNGEAVELDGEGNYTIENIQKDTTVTIEGVGAAIVMEVMGEEYHAVVDDITFELYSNKKQTLTITSAWDAKDIYYAEMNAKAIPAEIPEKDWNFYEGPVTISNTDRKAVFYARVMDDSGNVYYASTNGIVFDTTYPVVKVNGETVTFDDTHKFSMDCYTTQIVTAEDANLSKITLNNTNMSLTSEITLAGNLNRRNNLRISDAAGNAVQLTIQMHPIEDLKKSEEDLNRLDEILDEVRAHATPSEMAKLEEIQKNKDAYLAICMIQALPDAEDVKPYNQTHREDYKKAQAAYDALKDEEKTIVGDDNKARLQDVKAALAYKITTKATDLRWAKSSKKDLTVKANGANTSFEELWINGKKVASTKYTHKADAAGGTAITIDEAYLDTLAVGKYTIKVVYEDGETDGTDKIDILKAGTNPKTGDDGIRFWMTASVLSLACLAAVILTGGKRKFQA